MSTNIKEKLKNFDLSDAKRNRETMWLEPTDKVAYLSSAMKTYGYRHIPILKDDGSLACVVSIGDCVRIQTPRAQQLPVERLAKAGFQMMKLYDEVDKTGSMTIQEAFSDLFQRAVETVSEEESLEIAFNKLIARVDNRRYRTLPIVKANVSGISGMLSYTDLLTLIRDPNQENREFLSLKAFKIYTTEVKTFSSNQTLVEAIELLDGTPFRHIPLRQSDRREDTVITGIVDDITINTFHHKLLFRHLAKMPLSEVAQLSGEVGTLGEHNTASLDDDLETVIDKFLGETKPTAILIGSFSQKNFIMRGIVSYVDIFRKFLTYKLEDDDDGSEEELQQSAPQ